MVKFTEDNDTSKYTCPALILSFVKFPTLSRTMATMVGGRQELGGAGVGCGER